MNTIEPLNPDSLNACLSSNEPPLILDVREFAEYAGGHIHDSRLFPLREIERRASELPRDRSIVTVCRTGHRSEEAAVMLSRVGLNVVGHLEGGTMAWSALGLPLEREARAPWALERQVRLVAGVLVLLGLALSHVWGPAIVLSWFVSLGLVFAAATDSCAMGMFLAKMPWNNQNPAGSGRLAGE